MRIGRPRLGSVSSVGSGGSGASNVTAGADERRIRVDANTLGDLVVGDDDTIESGLFMPVACSVGERHSGERTAQESLE